MEHTKFCPQFIDEILAAVDNAPSFEEGIRRSLPILCVFFEGILGEARLRIGPGGQKNAWKKTARWPGAKKAGGPPHQKLDQLSKAVETIPAVESPKSASAIVRIPNDSAAPSPEKVLLIPIAESGLMLAKFIVVLGEDGKSGDEVLAQADCIASVLGVWSKKCRAEKQFRDLVDFIPNPLMMIDTRERVTVWNTAMEKMSGVRSSDILGKGDYEHALSFYGERRPTSSNLILHPESEWESRYLEFRKEKGTLYALARSEALPGDTMLIASKTGLTYDLAEAVTGSVHMIQDVTHEHELERSLTRTEKMYHSISEFAGVGIALLGTQKIYSCNENFIDLMDLDGTSQTVDDIMARIEPNDRHSLENLLSRFFNEAPPASFEFAALLPTKGRREFKGYAQSVNYENTTAIHFVIIDITESNEMERRKKMHQMRMYHSDRLTALGTLSAGIAHELNQPLNTIRVITDGLLFGKEQGWPLDEKELYENAAMISKQIMRMSQVIKNIKNFARDDKDRRLEKVDPNEAIQNVFSMIGQQLVAHGIQVEQQLEPDMPAIESQLNHLEQVIMNLVVNAQQALDSCGKKDKRLWVKTGRRFGQIFMEVGDNATGIAESHKKEIFDPFFTTKAVGQGTGLGLSLSQTIISDYNGVIKSYNNLEGGATFFITIPVETT